MGWLFVIGVLVIYILIGIFIGACFEGDDITDISGIELYICFWPIVTVGFIFFLLIKGAIKLGIFIHNKVYHSH